MIYDVHTKNISFLRVSKMLRERGVKNNKFMLTLYDPTLVGVDPYDPNLTELQKVSIYRECSINYWYFIREVVHIPADGASIKYEINLGNMTLGYLRIKNKNIILILPRQHGKTLGEVIFEVWNLAFVTKNTNVTYLNKAKGDTIKNLKLFRDVLDLLPHWMLDNFIRDYKNDIDNQENKLLARRNNVLKAVSGGSDPDAADKAGRGLTTSNIIFDEYAFMKYNEKVYKACQPAFKRASENAKLNNMPYGMVIITTPNNLDVESGAWCYSMIQNAAKWNFQLFDLTDDELDAYIENNSQNNFLFVQYSYKELGRSEEWLRQNIRECNGDTATVKREILLEWPRSMDSSVFSEDQLDKVYSFIKQPVTRIFVLDYYQIEFYEIPDFNLNYILSCDVSGGLSRDNSVINIIHPEDFRIVGDFRNNKIDTENFKKLIEKLMTFYIKNAILVVEKNSYGLNVIDYLMKIPDIERRMYREDKETLGEKKQANGFTVRKKTKTISYGVDTNVSTRKKMFDLLPEIVDTEYDKFVSPNIYSDLSSLEKKRNGKIEHSSSGHDDSLMAYLIFRYAVYHGTCFRDRFGISSVPSRVNVKTVSNTEDMKRIEGIIKMANEQADSLVSLRSNPLYEKLVEQDRMFKREDDSNKEVESFMRIVNFNK